MTSPTEPASGDAAWKMGEPGETDTLADADVPGEAVPVRLRRATGMLPADPHGEAIRVINGHPDRCDGGGVAIEEKLPVGKEALEELLLVL